MEDKPFLCTRPKLASKLMTAGYKGRQVINPWSPERTAWEFDKTPEMMEIVMNDTLAHDMAAARRWRERQNAKQGGEADA